MRHIPALSLFLLPLPSFPLLKASRAKFPFSLMILQQGPMALLIALAHRLTHPNQYPSPLPTSQGWPFPQAPTCLSARPQTRQVSRPHPT